MAKESSITPPWLRRNFVTEVLIPSLFQRRHGKKNGSSPVFPPLREGEFCITWIGHASFLIQTLRYNILIDPNWARWLLVIKRVRHAGMEVHHLPNIDVVLVTHAHFDHLHRKTLRCVASEQPIAVPKGVGPLVHDLGFEKIHEMSWWETWKLDETLDITFLPAKHWGARTVVDMHRGFGGFAIRYGGRVVYHSGDTAFFEGFEEIGARIKPELALLPIGSYDTPSGNDNHMKPEEALRAFKMLEANVLIPMHFGTYRLSFEPLHEPPQRLMKAAAEDGLLNKLRFLVEGMPQVF
jgi:L-ascorbate metabolism protein UlaG (beta-lactamase superfamily)